MNLPASFSNRAVSHWWTNAYPRRKAIGWLQPAAQLRLPVYLLAITLLFAGVFALQSYLAYSRLYIMTLSVAPASFEEIIDAQTGDFMIVTAVIGVAYVSAMLAAVLAYLHRLVGPTVAFRRHIRCLRRGDYSSRVVLRRSEAAFRELASDLNELASSLERRYRPSS